MLDPSAGPTIFGVSGYSGGGTVAGPNDPDGRPTTVAKTTPESLSGGIRAYTLTDHIHEREARHHLLRLPEATAASPLTLAFIPHVAPWFSGILSTLSAPLNRRVTAQEVRALYEEKYSKEALVKVLKGVPQLPDIENKHGWSVGGFQVHSSGRRVVVAVRIMLLVLSVVVGLQTHLGVMYKGGLDNLLKGAATQAVQVGLYWVTWLRSSTTHDIHCRT